jgi:hypothetical protein
MLSMIALSATAADAPRKHVPAPAVEFARAFDGVCLQNADRLGNIAKFAAPSGWKPLDGTPELDLIAGGAPVEHGYAFQDASKAIYFVAYHSMGTCAVMAHTVDPLAVKRLLLANYKLKDRPDLKDEEGFQVSEALVFERASVLAGSIVLVTYDKGPPPVITTLGYMSAALVEKSRHR